MTLKSYSSVTETFYFIDKVYKHQLILWHANRLSLLPQLLSM